MFVSSFVVETHHELSSTLNPDYVPPSMFNPSKIILVFFIDTQGRMICCYMMVGQELAHLARWCETTSTAACMVRMLSVAHKELALSLGFVFDANKIQSQLVQNVDAMIFLQHNK